MRCPECSEFDGDSELPNGDMSNTRTGWPVALACSKSHLGFAAVFYVLLDELSAPCCGRFLSMCCQEARVEWIKAMKPWLDTDTSSSNLGRSDNRRMPQRLSTRPWHAGRMIPSPSLSEEQQAVKVRRAGRPESWRQFRAREEGVRLERPLGLKSSAVVIPGIWG